MPHYGKYRGKVVNTVDPFTMGRLQVIVESVSGEDLQWALPSVPFAGPGVGFCMIPPVGASVWVEYEAGDLSLPIWTGCFWGIGEYPVEAQSATPENVQLIKSDGFLFRASSAETPGFTITVETPVSTDSMVITMDAKGIGIRNEASDAMIELSDDSIRTSVGGSGIAVLAEDLIELKVGDCMLAVNSNSVIHTVGAALMEMVSDAIDLSVGGTTITIGVGAITQECGAAIIEMGNGAVTINGGALEVI